MNTNVLKISAAASLSLCLLALACSSSTSNSNDTGGTDDTASSKKDSGPSTDDLGQEDFELNGSWTTNFDSTAKITNTQWKEYSTLKIISYDNKKNEAILQNPPADPDADGGDVLTADTFSKNVWTEEEDGVVYYCTVDFGLESADDAEKSKKTADEKDLDGEGCGGFPWTKLTRSEK